MEKFSRILLCLLFLTNSIVSNAQSANSKVDERSPFSKVLYKNNHPYIEINNTWVKLESIQNIPIEKIIRLAVDSCPKDWKNCFHEYWSYLMDDLKVERKDSIEVGYFKNGAITSQSLQLKKENPELAEKFHQSNLTKNKVNRARAKTIFPEYQYLTKRLDGFKKSNKDWLPRQEAIHDLEYLEWEIDHNYSYANLRGFEYKKALDAIFLNLKDGISKRDFAYQLKMFMTNFGDGHSRVSIRDVKKREESIWLPFEIIKNDEKFYAVNTNTQTFYNPEFPEILAINDIDIKSLFKLTKELVSKANIKSMDRDALAYLNYMGFALKLAGEQKVKKVIVTFKNDSEEQKEEFSLDKTKSPALLKRHRLKDTILESNIGYIAITEKMYGEDDFIEDIHQAMQNVKDTKGLIIDIRRNPGGKRDPLIAFLSYFITETKITNVGRFRINQKENLNPKYGFLERRFLYPLDIDEAYYNRKNEYTTYKSFKIAVDNFRNNFNPCRLISKEKYSDYHYMAVGPINSEKGFYYDKPVIVLIDEGCFSASDIFAAGIRQGDRVKLLGNTTQGGSGYSKSKTLPNSNIQVKLSRMFSYQPDGNLYDTHGVVPDIQVDYTLLDKLGRTDSQLETAVLYLKNGAME